MASSILRLTCQISKPAAGSCLRRILCSAGMSTTTGGGGSAVRRVAPPWLMQPPSSGDTAYSMYSVSHGKVVRLKQESDSPNPHEAKFPLTQKQEPESPNPNPYEAKVVGSSHGWLALHHERHRKLFLWNPISHQTMNLPLIDTFSLPIKDVLKVILLCPPDQVGDHDELVAVMSFSSPVGQKLARCHPGRSTIWTPFGGLSPDIGLMKQIPDFVYSSTYHRLYCLSEMEGKLGFHMGAWFLYRGWGKRGKLEASFMLAEPYLDAQEKYDRHLRRRRYFVYMEHSDQLFVVTRLLGDDDKTVGFHVRKLCDDRFFGSIDDGYMKESLDGLVMFVGPNHSCAVPVAEFPELKPNSIYFADGDDVGIYDYGNKTVSPCFRGDGVVQSIQPPAFWFTPTVPDFTDRCGNSFYNEAECFQDHVWCQNL